MKIKFWKNTKEDNNVNVKDVTGTPTIITRLNWKGSFANSTLITTGGEEEDILSTFTSIGDNVTTL